MTSDEIREAFLTYFESKGHQRVASSSLIPVGDPTLLLTTAGMVQFKPYFSGEATPANRRLTSSQKSFRTSDIDEVGDATHLTLFEMLGNFSIGDYFKEGAIQFALECFAEAFGIEKERFSITIHESDDEAFELWRKVGVPEELIYRFGDADNWWGPAGLEGPCGPCTELHYDFGKDRGCGKADCGPNCANTLAGSGDACNRYVELWNLVFMQYYHHLDGSRTPLPAPSVDTGLGLERLCAVLQDAETFYETDLFGALIRKVEELSGKGYQDNPETRYAMRVVAEHGRSATFLIADGVVPGNEGRSYVLRRVVRRAIRHGRRLGLEEAFLGEIARVAIEQMRGVYPELGSHEEFVLTVLDLEEKGFAQTMDRGMNVLADETNGVIPRRRKLQEVLEEFLSSLEGQKQIHRKEELERRLTARISFETEDYVQPVIKPAIHEGLVKPLHKLVRPLVEGDDAAKLEAQEKIRQISGQEAFVLWDTYGFPVEVTEEIAREYGLEVDLEGFEQQMEGQRERARASAQFSGDRAETRVYESLGVGATRFLGYERLAGPSVLVGLISGGRGVAEAKEGDEVEVVLVETPFYPEGGGQVGDAGELLGPNGRIEVRDTQTVVPELIVHFGVVAQGTVAQGDSVEGHVDGVRREDTARNHTATHLLHAALRQVLGAHVRQAGSLVAPDRLRFDFSHVEPMTEDEIETVQWLVNEKIRENVGVHKSEDSYTSAMGRGALAFFGDKYGDTVRLVEIADGVSFSFEVCGGTHVEHTGELGAVYILGESSIGAGMRRIEAVSGRGAERVVRQRFNYENELARRLQTTLPGLKERVEGLLDELDQVRREKEALERRQSMSDADDLLPRKQEVDGVSVLAVRVEASSAGALREMGDRLKDKLGSGVVVLGSVVNERPVLVAMVTRDLVDRGLDASKIAKGAAKAIQGGGGGSAELAEAGGKKADKLDEALGLVPGLVRIS